jgi:2-methylcitrate dehydratase
MDKTCSLIARFAADLDFGHLKDKTVAAAKRSLVDTIGCLLGGYESREAGIARAVAPHLNPGVTNGRIIGLSGRSTSREAAAFANTVAIRYLDFNDRLPGFHPSDSLGALLAIGESVQATGEDLVGAMVVAYEVASVVTNASGARKKGVDQGMAIGIGVAASIARLRGLGYEEIGHAIAITVASHVPLHVARTGTISPWKAAATGHVARNAVAIVDMVAEGMRGPSAPFEGPDGLFNLLGRFDVGSLASVDRQFSINNVDMKVWPACYRLQASIFAGQELHQRIDAESLAKVTVHTHATAARGTEPDKYDPTTRETADHSIPFVLARTLISGAIGVADFSEKVFADPSLRPLMNKIEVVEDPEIEAAYPDDLMVRVSATNREGRTETVEIVNPKGHGRNPLNADDVSEKFLSLAGAVLGRERAQGLLTSLWRIPDERDLAPVFEEASLVAPESDVDAK